MNEAFGVYIPVGPSFKIDIDIFTPVCAPSELLHVQPPQISSQF
jgi:hypothetical protein